MQAQENLIRGIIDIALLQLLKEQDMYGYELLQEIRKRSDNNIIVKDGSLYPVMYRMVDRGIVSEETVLVGKRRTRKYYHLTDEGREFLDRNVEEYLKIAKGMELLLNTESDGSLEK